MALYGIHMVSTAGPHSLLVNRGPASAELEPARSKALPGWKALRSHRHCRSNGFTTVSSSWCKGGFRQHRLHTRRVRKLLRLGCEAGWYLKLVQARSKSNIQRTVRDPKQLPEAVTLPFWFPRPPAPISDRSLTQTSLSESPRGRRDTLRE